MKIAIVTFCHTTNNYGQVLQCYALQQYLKKTGHSPFVLRQVPLKGFRESVYQPIFFCLDFIRNVKKYGFSAYLKERKKQKNNENANQLFNADRGKYIDQFREEHFVFSDPIPADIEILRKKAPHADVYIAGSDIIWGIGYSLLPNRSIWFLDFLPETVKRISYAPSFGCNMPSDDFTQKIRSSLQRFHAVSVREDSGIDICQKAGRPDAVHVIDPTGLLTKKEYLHVAELVPVQKDPFLFMYVLNFETKEQILFSEIENFCKESEINLKLNVAQCYDIISCSRDIPADFCMDSVPQWLAHYRDAKYIITNSFHGTIFSVIFRKQFLVLPLKGRCEAFNERQYSLLRKLNLEDRIIRDKQTIPELISKPIEWDKVEPVLDTFISQSKHFLENALTEKK